MTVENDTVPQVTPAQATELIARGAYLLDVREPDEWQAGHSPEAHHMPLGQLTPDSLPTDRTIITVCRSGTRSSKAGLALRDAGLTVRNLDGGMQAWAANGLPVQDDSGATGRVA